MLESPRLSDEFGGLEHQPITPSAPHPLTPGLCHDTAGSSLSLDFPSPPPIAEDDTDKPGKKRKVEELSAAALRYQALHTAGFLRVPQAIDTIAQNGKSLRYEDGNYIVLDGPGFEEEFNHYRVTREKAANSKPKSTNSRVRERPFASMHRFYKLVRGDKWAQTGVIFTLKGTADKKEKLGASDDFRMEVTSSIDSVNGQDARSPEEPWNSSPMAPSPDVFPDDAPSRTPSLGKVTADQVIVQLNDDNGIQTAIDLQHFLNVTGAGKLYMRATSANIHDAEVFQGYHSNTLMDPAMSSHIVESLWSADSRGDQAYWFKRKEGLTAQRNGAIVCLVDGQLTTDQPSELTGALYMVVSDKNVKWKGEPIPSPEEEPEGHWCAFLGQVPVHVEGPARTGDYIGPKSDGSGVAVVVSQLSKSAIVGIALEDKLQPEQGVLRTLVFAGLNALRSNTQKPFEDLLQQNLDVEEEIENIKSAVVNVQRDVVDVQKVVVDTKGEVEEVAQRLSHFERQAESHRKGDLESGEEEEVVSGVISQCLFNKGYKKYVYSCCCLFVIFVLFLILLLSLKEFGPRKCDKDGDGLGSGGKPAAPCDNDESTRRLYWP